MIPLLANSEESKRPPAAILVVDDDVVVLDALCAQLACDGWEVTACGSASDALAALRGKKYAAIISDQNMPEMKGLEFLTLAREIQPAASRMLITGMLSTGTLIQAINHGEIYRFLSKPWTRAELLVSVRNAVQRHELAAANDQLHQEMEILRATLARTDAALQAARRGEAPPTLPVRNVSSGAGMLTQRGAGTEPAHGPMVERAAEQAAHVHLVGYC